MKSKNNYIYLFYILLAFSTLYLIKSYPKISILISSLILLIYIITRLKKNIAYLVLLYPFLIYIISFFYNKNFLSLGDNEGYYGPLMDTLPFYGKAKDSTIFVSNLTSLDGLQYLKLGFLPVIIIPDFLYNFQSEIIYYYFQSFYFLFLVTYLVFYISKYEILKKNEFNIFVIFLIFSPSIILLGLAPTRHYFTLFSVLLFYFSFINFNSTKSKKHLITLFVSVLFTILSKTGYILAYFIFIIIFYRNLVKIKKIYLNIIYSISFLLIIYLAIFLLPKYNGITSSGLSSFNWVLSIPILGPLSKYIFDILSPFPHYNFIHLSNEVYGGNLVFFLCHIFGILYIFVVIFNLSNIILRYNKNYKLDSLTLFGCVMSLTILPASAGFNGYISIFYPFFIFYFFQKNLIRKLFFSLILLTIINISFFTISLLK